MRILTLDLAKQLGWATFSNETGHHVVRSGSLDLAPDNLRQYESYNMRYVRFRRFLTTRKRPNLIGYEAVRAHRRKGQRGHNLKAAHAFGGYRAVLGSWADEFEIPYTGYEVGDIKKRATGKGNASKEQMVKAAAKLFHREVEDDNEADALWILALVLDQEGITLKL